MPKSSRHRALAALVGLGLVGFTTMSIAFRYRASRSFLSESERAMLASKMAARRQPDGDRYGGLSYRLFVPPRATPGAPLPLVLYLHSAAGNGRDNLSQLSQTVAQLTSDEIQGPHPSYVAAPQCPPGKEWTDVRHARTPYANVRVDDTAMSDRVRALVHLVDDLQAAHGIDPNRVYVIGYSMGSSGAWDLIIRHPDRFAAAITMSGVSDPGSAGRIAHLPIWAFHGRFDRVSPIRNSIDMVAALKEHGSPIRLTKLLWGHGIENIVSGSSAHLEWLFEQERRRPRSKR